MSQTLPIQQVSVNQFETSGLCLLSLDGGGVRGLSTLYILKGLMAQLNLQRQSGGLARVKPCEIFDLIGGTSTGGLIAIMLGRLEMDVDECIRAYSDLMKAVFEKKSSWLPFTWTGKVTPQFDSAKLQTAVEDVIASNGASPGDCLNDNKARKCRTFVCAISTELADVTRLRSYTVPNEDDIGATICEAALATTAATGFFPPVSIGARQFSDAALGANNPIDEVEGEAADIWAPGTGDLKPLVKCFISIGTGKPGKKALAENAAKFLANSLVSIVTDTERTGKTFIARWAKHFDEKRYFRFNVDEGLQNVGLAEHKEQGKIEAATAEYLRHTEQKFRARDCVQNLLQKQNNTKTYFESYMNLQRMHGMEQLQSRVSARKAAARGANISKHAWYSEDDFSKVSDPTQRRKIQNRLAQRAWRMRHRVQKDEGASIPKHAWCQEDDWSKVSDPTQRHRIQCRLAQRARRMRQYIHEGKGARSKQFGKCCHSSPLKPFHL